MVLEAFEPSTLFPNSPSTLQWPAIANPFPVACYLRLQAVSAFLLQCGKSLEFSLFGRENHLFAGAPSTLTSQKEATTGKPSQHPHFFFFLFELIPPCSLSNDWLQGLRLLNSIRSPLPERPPWTVGAHLGPPLFPSRPGTLSLAHLFTFLSFSFLPSRPVQQSLVVSFQQQQQDCCCPSCHSSSLSKIFQTTAAAFQSCSFIGCQTSTSQQFASFTSTPSIDSADHYPVP